MLFTHSPSTSVTKFPWQAEAFEVVVSNEEAVGDLAAAVEVGGVVIAEGEVIADEADEAVVAAAAEGEVVPTQSSSHTDIQAYS